jgi:ABC-type branched-subunit amino acid transport system substrate-binding protein
MTDRLRIGACLSLTGKFARFGRQAALGLEAWRSLDGTGVVTVEDDHSERRTLEAVLPGVAARSDILLGPYSTILMRAAGRIAADSGRLIWNHGGSGDDVEQAHPGHMVSVLTPTSRYAEPFLRYIASGDQGPRDLYVVQGPGSFGRQVAEGAAMMADQSGVRVVRAEPGGFPPPRLPAEWDLFSAGVFEQDAELVAKSLRLPNPPRRVCTVAAGVREFTQAVDNPEGVFGIAQWFAGSGHEVTLGPSEEKFLRAYEASGNGVPDYPAVQAAAAAIIGANCANLAGSTNRDDLWAAASGLKTSTMFGGFKIDPRTGTKVSHRTVLVRWTEGKLVPVTTSTRQSAESPQDVRN